MSLETVKRTGYTKTGFSKGFGCCGHFNVCQMGKTSCYYEVTDPETMNYCAAFLRNNSNNQEEELQQLPSLPSSKDNQVDLDLPPNEVGQLSFF